MEFLALPSLDPAFNLALEEQLLNTLAPEHPGLFLLWQNNPVVVVGRHQNILDEVDLAFIEQENIPVVRRITGGGAVYHDTGNLNFSFIENARGRRTVDFERYLRPICAALADVGVTAALSGRNDLMVGDAKISGSGQLLRRDKVLHHGTLLVTLDFERLARALRPAPEKYLSKNVASVRSRVCNISELWLPGTTMDTLKCTLLKHCAQRPARLAMTDYGEAERLAGDKYRQREWNYGPLAASAACAVQKKERFAWGSVELRLDLYDGCISRCCILGDFFSSSGVEALENRLTGQKHDPKILAEVLADVDWEACFSGCDPHVMRCFFSE